ncbi:response regulator [Undibacterium sp. TJN19]|uniref:response regulator n=1 Tax=Undibacterium sp. TJN19 TaxID=3413055 RepID=UPI003BF2F2E8
MDVKLSILLAENNLDNQHQAVALLEQFGHTVHVCDNGAEALHAIEVEKFDLVLMDMQMPVLGGIETSTAIRAQEDISGDHIPIIAMTEHLVEDEHERCRAAGMDEYLSKPINAKNLMACIISVLHLEPDGSELPLSQAALSPPCAKFDYVGAINQTNPEVLDIVGKLALTHIPAHIAEISKFLEDGNAEKTQRAAHTLKGIIAYFSAEPLVERAKKIEACAKQMHLCEARQHYDLLRADLENFLPLLEAKLSGKIQPL